MAIVIENVELKSLACGGCGIVYAVPRHWLKEKRENKGDIRCPNGCARTFNGKTEAQRLSEELAAQKRRTEYMEAELATARRDKDRKDLQLRAAKGQMTKLRNRVGKGVCPCCNRSFGNLQRHMHTKHPEFAAAEAASA